MRTFPDFAVKKARIEVIPMIGNFKAKRAVLENGLKLKHFLTYRRMIYLYNAEKVNNLSFLIIFIISNPILLLKSQVKNDFPGCLRWL